MSDLHSTSRRGFLAAVGALALGAAGTALVAQPPRGAARGAAAKGAAKAITVYKDPNCGCCKLWVDHMKAAGFSDASPFQQPNRPAGHVDVIDAEYRIIESDEAPRR